MERNLIDLKNCGINFIKSKYDLLKFQSDAFSGVKQVLSFFRFMVSILETSAQLPFLKNKIKIMLINQSINFKKNDN